MDYHRYFGLLLTDFFNGTPFDVELEKDRSLKQQFLDVVIIRKRPGEVTERLPDGLEDLADHNLITFKSHHEALDDWALKELTGHYVNYRKQLSPADQPLLPENAFRLYAVCSRFPQNLAQAVPLEQLGEGVYQGRRGTDVFRILVLRQMALREENAQLLVLSDSASQSAYGRAHFRQRSPDTSSLIADLLDEFRKEGIVMPYTMEDFRRDFKKKFLKNLTAEERVEDLSLDQLLKALTPEQRELLRQQLTTESPGQPT